MAVPSISSTFRSRFLALGLIAALGLTAPAFAQNAPDNEQDSIDRDYTAELPRIPPTEPADVLSTFEVKPGFKMDLIAAEPLVLDPVAIAFDEDGRANVVDMCGYSEERDENRSVVALLEDTDGDGKYDKRSEFLTGLGWPVAVACYDGGVFVGVPPDILYCKDTNGDGVADIKKQVYTGFSLANVQGMMNTFLWGIEGGIHASSGTVGGEVKLVSDPNAPTLSLHGRDFVWDPRSGGMLPESGGGQHGMSYDDWGHKFICQNSDHIQLIMFEDRYTARNPYLPAPSPHLSIAVDGPSADVYRISPVEPWRIVRTRLRVKGITPGIIEGGGKASGYFTSATGVTIYRGDAWPAEYRDNAFVADCGSNLIHRKVLDQDGVSLKAHRAAGEEKTEFVRSKDIWFRPVQFANGPDGNLIVLDMYREVIEHPASLPPIIKKHLDLTSGRDRGRLYRITTEDFKQPAIPKLSQFKTADLVPLLEHKNAWHSDTASRLLFERQDKSVVPAIEALVTQSKSDLGRKNALYALNALNAMTPKALLAGMDDESPMVRANAVRLSHPYRDDAQVQAKICALANDPDIRVRYQAAFSLGDGKGAEVNAALAGLAKRDGADQWFRLAILSSSLEGSAEILALLLKDEAYRANADSGEILTALAQQVGARGLESELTGTLSAIDSLPDAEAALAQSQVRALMQGLIVGGKGAQAETVLARSKKAEGLLRQSLEQARAVAPDTNAKPEARVDAIKTLQFDTFESCKALLPPLLDQRQPIEVQLASVACLRKFEDVSIAQLLLDGWDGFSPQVRAQSVEALFSRKLWMLALLDAIEKGQFKPAQLDSVRIRALQTSADAEIHDRAEKLLAQFNFSGRQNVVDSYMEVLKVAGDAANGKKVFTENCSKCHMLQGTGFQVGPDLSTMANAGAGKILVNVLDPNREVNPQYLNYTVNTDDLESHSGVIASQSATSITLKRANGETDTILRVNIESMRSDSLSIMPEGLEQAIDKKAMADLLAYLTSIK